MRIWSVHPQYLDTKGLVALWRETLLAKHVLSGRTNGYKNHPQLTRFKEMRNPVGAIDQYLSEVYNEAVNRGYQFDSSKINRDFRPVTMNVTTGQLSYETQHLLRKLKERDTEKYEVLKHTGMLTPHPMFAVCAGDVESWEKF